MEENHFGKLICKCTKEDCPYHLEHCLLGELDAPGMEDTDSVTGRLECRKKKSRKVLCMLKAA